MDYFVVLNPAAAFTALYDEHCDQRLKAGDQSYPCLICSEADMDHPHYLFVRRPTKEGHSHQAIHIPHAAIVAVYRIGEGEPAPIGFL
ncbi:hypothetical protein [Cupriavidus sp. Agwp_2]|uniref:hypothetical protein n=1 Tax=Cupriavidus sp. Agwp_2 TaxID=2897324 RepID=UPI00346177A9